MSEKGNYLLAVIRAKESYETLAESLKDLIKEMELLTEITLDNITYPLEYFLGGDWKFFLNICVLVLTFISIASYKSEHYLCSVLDD